MGHRSAETEARWNWQAARRELERQNSPSGVHRVARRERIKAAVTASAVWLGATVALLAAYALAR